MLVLYIRFAGDKKKESPKELSHSYVKVILSPSSQWNQDWNLP